MSAKDIELLKDDKHYYGELGRKYLSNSDVGALLHNPKKFKQSGEETKAMIEGRYFHTAMLEPEKLDNFEFVDVSSRNTKAYKELDKLVLLQKEKEWLDELVNTMKSNLHFYDLIYNEGNQYEVPGLAEIGGIMWKGKADVLTEEYVVDLKTTSSLSDFRRSCYKYNYDSQSYIYKCIFGKPMMFLVIDKTTMNMGIFESSEAFVQSGKDKVTRALEVYNTFFSADSKEDITNYFKYEVL